MFPSLFVLLLLLLLILFCFFFFLSFFFCTGILLARGASLVVRPRTRVRCAMVRCAFFLSSSLPPPLPRPFMFPASFFFPFFLPPPSPPPPFFFTFLLLLLLLLLLLVLLLLVVEACRLLPRGSVAAVLKDVLNYGHDLNEDKPLTSTEFLEELEALTGLNNRAATAQSRDIATAHCSLIFMSVF